MADLHTWGDAQRRDLPWRDTRDPWEILVSELMLQQTQVARVVPRWAAFLQLFPTIRAAADAPRSELIRAWQGLGYPRRAVNLHRCAQVVVEEHDGAVPDDLDALLALPGIGPYTARAILAFAFERDVGVVDTNASRFLSRAVVGERLTARTAQTWADVVVPGGTGWAHNQAVLDLGATVCVRRSPRCDDCPIRSRCAWARAGFAEEDPAGRSAGAPTRQARFDGSDRQGRGRLVAALGSGDVPVDDAARAMGWPDDAARASRVVADLVRDGLVVEDRGMLALPD